MTDGDGENMSSTARRVMRAESRNYDNCPGDFLCSPGWEQELLWRLIEMYPGINYLDLNYLSPSHSHQDKWRDYTNMSFMRRQDIVIQTKSVMVIKIEINGVTRIQVFMKSTSKSVKYNFNCHQNRNYGINLYKPINKHGYTFYKKY